MQEPTATQDAGASSTGEGGSNWLSRWKQRQEIHRSYYAAARSGTAAQPQAAKRHPTVHLPPGPAWNKPWRKEQNRRQHPAVKRLMNAAKSNAHVLVIVGVFFLLILMVMSGFFLLRHPLFRRHTGVRADHVLCRGPGTSGRRTGLQELEKENWIKNQAHSHRPPRLQRVPVPSRPHRA